MYITVGILHGTEGNLLGIDGCCCCGSRRLRRCDGCTSRCGPVGFSVTSLAHVDVSVIENERASNDVFDTRCELSVGVGVVV